MYFINFGKCEICKFKKSVAIDKKVNKKICADCDENYYNSVAEKQKEFWISGGKKKVRNS